MYPGTILGQKNLVHLRFNLYWPAETHDRKDNRVLIAVRKDLLNTMVIENRINLISHPYGMVVNITEGDIHGRGQKRKTRIVNVYDSKLGEGQIW